MRLIAAFLRLVRLPNLFFIALSQVLFQVCIYQTLYRGNIPENDSLHFIFLLLASLFIAAAGYIINDYFDINIDEVNKPHRMVVDKLISRRWAIAWHFMLSVTGIILTTLALPGFQKWYLVLANIFCVALLWFYSTSFKKKLLSGNVIISLLTAWTVLVLYFVTNNTYHFGVNFSVEIFTAMNRIFKFSILYGGFAFIISLIREVIKDIEDREGDARYNCKTMPIVWGIPASKVFAGVWLVVLIGALAIIQFYVFQLGWWLTAMYSLLLVILPLIWILRKLYTAQSISQYHQLSSVIKLVMLSGILSMVFFKIHV